MTTRKFRIKPDSVLHRLLKMIAEEVAKEFSTTVADRKVPKTSRRKSKKRPHAK